MGGMGDHESGPGSRFPMLVAGICLGLAALLYFTGLLPAMRERDELDRADRSRQTLLRDLATRAHDLRERQDALDRDPQSVLVEIDALGMTPDELLDAYPEPETR